MATATTRKNNKSNKSKKSSKANKPTLTTKTKKDPKAMLALLVAKYPDQDFVANSFKHAGDDNGMEKKASVEIHCCQCGTVRRIATSDAFQTRTCSDACRKAAKKADAAPKKGKNGKK
jgi:hypothetical protein